MSRSRVSPEAQRAVAERFGRNLTRCRREADLSQGSLGLLAELHSTAIGLLERGERLARIDTVVRLAGALEVDPCELLAGITWKPASLRSGRFNLGESEKDADV
jgi:transcriptional regulator with XRE-family HTH domain